MSKQTARPCNIKWVRSLKEQCNAAGVSCFVKQLGSNPIYTCAPPYDSETEILKLKDRKGGDWDEWPADLRVREFYKP